VAVSHQQDGGNTHPAGPKTYKQISKAEKVIYITFSTPPQTQRVQQVCITKMEVKSAPTHVPQPQLLEDICTTKATTVGPSQACGPLAHNTRSGGNIYYTSKHALARVNTANLPP
jgi:hypothetical protein